MISKCERCKNTPHNGLNISCCACWRYYIDDTVYDDKFEDAKNEKKLL